MNAKPRLLSVRSGQGTAKIAALAGATPTTLSSSKQLQANGCQKRSIADSDQPLAAILVQIQTACNKLPHKPASTPTPIHTQTAIDTQTNRTAKSTPLWLASLCAEDGLDRRQYSNAETETVPAQRIQIITIPSRRSTSSSCRRRRDTVARQAQPRERCPFWPRDA